MDVIPIPAFRDNYIWCIREGGNAALVDPGDGGPALDFLERSNLELTAILVTHHHPDHVGGIDRLLANHGVPVFGPAREAIRQVTSALSEGDQLRIPGMQITLSVLEVPGHTRGHISYYGANRLFCGDTLFACGCGRLFEGTAEQMWGSLSRLASLPAETAVYCAHEYTQSNIDFALAAEPGNESLQRRAERVDELREKRQPTLPSTIGEELETNPFLRVGEREIIESASRAAGRPLQGAIEVFAALREWKNRF